jgi:hypothetical protein
MMMTYPFGSSCLLFSHPTKLTMARLLPSRRRRSRLLGVRGVLTLCVKLYGSIPLVESFLAPFHVTPPPMLTSGANRTPRSTRDGLSPIVLPLTGRQPDPRSFGPSTLTLQTTADSGSNDTGTKGKRKRKTFWECLASAVSQRAAIKASPTYNAIGATAKDRTKVQIKTLIRVVLPSLAVGAAAIFAFPGLSMFLVSLVNDQGAMTVLSTDSSQFVQNFLSVSSLLFSILVGQTYVPRCSWGSVLSVSIILIPPPTATTSCTSSRRPCTTRSSTR